MPLTTYNGEIFESQEEAWFAMWCNELVAAGYVKYWHKFTEPWEVIPELAVHYIKTTKLKTKINRERKKIAVLQDLEYTPDFQVDFTPAGFKLFCTILNENYNKNSYFIHRLDSEWADPLTYRCYVEVKPTFDKHGKTARFAVLQKIIWHVKKMFVNLVITEKLFEDTFMPAEAAPDFKYKIKAKAGEWKTKYKPKTLKEYINEITKLNN